MSRRKDRHATHLKAAEQWPVAVDETQHSPHRDAIVLAALEQLAYRVRLSEHAVDVPPDLSALD